MPEIGPVPAIVFAAEAAPQKAILDRGKAAASSPHNGSSKPARRPRRALISDVSGTSDLLSLIPAPTATATAVKAPIKRQSRLTKAEIVEDGHSPNEQTIYDALWSAARPLAECDSADRFIRIGYDRLAKITSLSWVSVKANLRSLQKKLAIDIIANENSATREGKAYRVYSRHVILQRRKRAGLEWVRRTRGVELIAVCDPGSAAKAAAGEHFCTGRGGPGSGGNAYPRGA
jgi:hypothetical protein